MQDSHRTIEELSAKLREAALENSQLQSRNGLLQQVQADHALDCRLVQEHLVGMQSVSACQSACKSSDLHSSTCRSPPQLASWLNVSLQFPRNPVLTTAVPLRR